ncbi:MAG: hypothetical protein GX279_13605 [Clostridiaceae bacterium]|nr:hypothetical protein [Clostridiaceae bacterium]
MSNSDRLEDILVNHYEIYPRTQIQDMVKLIYQSEFAGGHMVDNKAESLKRLREEMTSVLNTSGSEAMARSMCSCSTTGIQDVSGYAAICADAAAGMDGQTKPVTVSGLFEDIGNGLCRLHLRGLKSLPVSLETINGFFVYTANSNKGSMADFEDKLDVLRDLCRRGILPYSVSDLDEYLSAYKMRGYPPVSHSDDYREAYSPAYRVVSSVFMEYFEVFCRIDALIGRMNKQPVRNIAGAIRSVNVAIEGNSGAGKSSLAALLQQIYDCNVFHMDHFFLTPVLRTEERLREAGGNVDYVRFKKEVIDGLRSGNEFSYQTYDCSKGSLDQIVKVEPKILNIIEGSYSMHPTLADSYDLKIFLGIGAEEQSRRILERNGSFMHEKFISLWIPLENRYFSELDIASQCDIVYNG